MQPPATSCLSFASRSLPHQLQHFSTALTSTTPTDTAATLHHAGEQHAKMAPRTFISLPPEVRNLIYYFAFSNDRALQVVSLWDKIKQSYTLKSDPSSCVPALLATCRTVNSEGTSILYGDGKIIIGAAQVPELVKQIGTNIKHLRRFQIDFHGNTLILKRAIKCITKAHDLDILRIGIFILGGMRNTWYSTPKYVKISDLNADVLHHLGKWHRFWPHGSRLKPRAVARTWRTSSRR